MTGLLSVSVYDYDSATLIDVSERTQHVSVTEKVDAISTVTVSVKDFDETHAFDDVSVTYAGRPIFTGVIESQSDTLRGGHTLYRYSVLNGSDFALKFENRIVNRIYENVYIETIIADLLSSYSVGITGNNVRPTYKTIDRIVFQYTTLMECIRQLAEIAGWRWYVDANRDLHFFDVDEGAGNITFSTTTAGGLKRNILRDTIEMSTEINDKTANRVWVVGAKQASPAYTEQFWTGDGNNAVFTTAFIPNYPEVYENGVPKTIEADRGAMSDKNYVYDKKNRVLKRNAGALPAGVTLRFRYRPTVQVIDYFEDSASIAKYGIYEKAVRDKTITEKLAARARGRAELKRRSNAIQRISFDTRELNVERGKRYRVVIPEIGLDAHMLCVSVTTNIAAPDDVNVMKTVELEGVT